MRQLDEANRWREGEAHDLGRRPPHAAPASRYARHTLRPPHATPASRYARLMLRSTPVGRSTTRCLQPRPPPRERARPATARPSKRTNLCKARVAMEVQVGHLRRRLKVDRLEATTPDAPWRLART